MKKVLTLSAVALIVSSSFAMAGNGNGQGKADFSTYDTDANGVITSEEATGKLAKKFDKIDADGDQQITQTEFEQMKGQKGNKGKKGKKNARKQFQKMDANNDGQVTEEEFNTYRAEREAKAAERIANQPTFAELDSDGDGQVTLEQLQALKGKKGGNQGKGNKQGQGNKANKYTIDTDGNGTISETEFNAWLAYKAEKRAEKQKTRPTFADMDADGNGVITKEEYKAFRKQRSAEKKAAKQAAQHEQSATAQ